MQKVSRRAILCAAPAVPVTVVIPAVQSSDIAELFAAWMAVQQEPCDDLADFQDTDRHERYVRLQAAIRSAKPVTARDLAMQFYAATDAGGSEYPDEFMEHVEALISA